MIFRRYGNAYQSVELNFDSKALNEIGFRRDRVESIPTDELEAFEKKTTHELVAEAEGSVQDETEQLLLERLAEQLLAIDRNLGTGEILVVDNDQGNDWPKTKQQTKNHPTRPMTTAAEAPARVRHRVCVRGATTGSGCPSTVA